MTMRNGLLGTHIPAFHQTFCVSDVVTQMQGSLSPASFLQVGIMLASEGKILPL
jgi:hypothetical protein